MKESLFNRISKPSLLTHINSLEDTNYIQRRLLERQHDNIGLKNEVIDSLIDKVVDLEKQLKEEKNEKTIRKEQKRLSAI